MISMIERRNKRYIMVKLLYQSNSEVLELDDWTSFKQPPQWWKSLTPFTGGVRSTAELIRDRWDILIDPESVQQTSRTVKTCPGFSSLFKQSLPIKLPADILIETTKDTWRWSSPAGVISMNDHNPDQAEGSVVSEKYHILKFEIPIVYMTDKKVTGCFVDPIYYNDVDFKVAPGILQGMEKQPTFLNVIVFFPRQFKRYHLKKGTVIALLQLSEKITAVQPKEMVYETHRFLYNLHSQIFNSKSKDRV